MKQYLIPILLVLVLGSGMLVACDQKSEAPASPTPAEEEWEAVNRLLTELYRLPPVKNIEELQAAASLVSAFWFEQADNATKKLEQNGIPWARTAPFCYTFNYYILHDIQLTNASTPLEFLAAEHLLVQTVRDLQDDAEELVRMKWLGEPLKIFHTTKDAMESFKEIDKDWEGLMKEATEKGK